MSYIGIDFGSDACVIGHVTGLDGQNQHLGVDIVLNDASNRRTPYIAVQTDPTLLSSSIVSFKGSRRFVGEHAEPYVQSNVHNTVKDLKKLLGHKYDDEVIRKEIKTLPLEVNCADDNNLSIKVEYSGSKADFSPEQILAIILKHCCQLVQKSERSTADPSVVISVPAFWNDFQRQAMVDACRIGGIKLKTLVNEHVSVAIDYGLFRNVHGEFSATAPKIVLFADMGYSNTTISIVSFVKDSATVLACNCDPSLGSSSFDEVIATHIAEDFKKKHGLDPREYRKSKEKLRVASSKAKLILSPKGVDRAPINIECLYQDYDYNAIYYLSEFQRKCKETGLIDRFKRIVQCTIQEANLKVEEISSVEIVGGGMRVPQLKLTLAELLKRNVNELNHGLSTTLNMDECICKGTTWFTALNSPEEIKMKPFPIKDHLYYDYTINDKTVLARGEPFPLKKTVTVPVHRDGYYVIRSTGSAAPLYTIVISEEMGAQYKEIQFEIEVDSNGCLKIQSVSAQQKGSSKKIQYYSENYRYDHKKIKQFIEYEAQMNKNEQERVETDRVLNDFESDLIQKKREFEELESMYITEKEREAMRYLIMDAEDWLEEKRSFVSLEDAKGFYERLIKSFNKVLDRKKENNLRNEKIVELFNICSSLKRNLKDVEENYQNVNANDCKTHLKSIETVENWLKKKVSEQSVLPLTEEPVLHSYDIDTKIKDLQNTVEQFINLPRERKSRSQNSTGKSSQQPRKISVDSSSEDSDYCNSANTSDLSDFSDSSDDD